MLPVKKYKKKNQIDVHQNYLKTIILWQQWHNVPNVLKCSALITISTYCLSCCCHPLKTKCKKKQLNLLEEKKIKIKTQTKIKCCMWTVEAVDNVRLLLAVNIRIIYLFWIRVVDRIPQSHTTWPPAPAEPPGGETWPPAPDETCRPLRMSRRGCWEMDPCLGRRKKMERNWLEMEWRGERGFKMALKLWTLWGFFSAS